MNLTIGKKIGVGFALALAALLVIGVATALNLNDLDKGTFWVTHSIEVKRRLSAVFAAALEAESSARGYQLLPAPEVRQLAASSRQTAEENLAALKQLTSDNAAQVSKLMRLEALTRKRLDDSLSLIDTRDRTGGNSVDSRQRALVQTGRADMDALRRVITDMVAEEDRLLVTRQKEEAATSRATWNTIIYGTLAAFALITLAGALVTRSITHAIRVVGEGAERIGRGDYGHRVAVLTKDEISKLAGLFNRMAEQIAERQAALTEQDWFKSGLTRFAQIFEGQREPAAVGRAVLAELATLLEVRHSVLYVPRETDDGTRLRLRASYAADHAPIEIAPGEGLIGQAYTDGKRLLLDQVPEGYLRIRSALGEKPPACIVVLPARFEGRVCAVLELAGWRRFNRIELDLLDRLGASLGIALNVIDAGQRTEDLLRKAQALTESLRASEMELQEQQEELKQANEELEQTNEEMQQTNEEMEEKVHLLAEQKQELERANRDTQLARIALEDKARQVEQASKYKTDFLASMSHELRTPLNSMLILSKLLADNPEGSLTPKQVQYAQTIHGSGNSLLELINDILDLSKIEAGSVRAEFLPVALAGIRQAIQDEFGPVAESKGLRLAIEFDPALPGAIQTDERRLLQIIKNLLSNAFKFTAKGSVTLRAGPAAGGWDPGALGLNRAAGVLAFAVEDTGIGIPADKHRMIFEAFQQGEAGTARKYGGTGLGLSISRELALLLGGSISVASKPGAGSVFTLYLPATPPSAALASVPPPPSLTAAPSAPEPPIEAEADAIPDDRAVLGPGDLVLLVVEDDPAFARILMDFAREKKFKVLVARTAESALRLARRHKPSAITLDLKLPDSDGRVVLDRLKHDAATRHIPIHIISVDAEAERSLRQGAVSSLRKPVTKEAIDAALGSTLEFLRRPLKSLLIVEDDPGQRDALAALIGGGDVQITAAASAAEAFAALEGRRYDCVVVDLGLPDRAGLDLIREIHRRLAPHPPPIIVYTGKDLTREEETQLRLLSNSIVLKSARSPERLLEETALFLHRVQARLPPPAREMIERAMKNDSVLAGRKVLVVDDDVRNIFAITSALESAQMEVRYAESGQGGIDLLQREPDIEAVLMDVMMPEMDGFEAIRRIRAIDRFRKIPIISVTAKAMKGDREKCLEAGASDYITKPVDMDQLRSLLRVWLYR